MISNRDKSCVVIIKYQSFSESTTLTAKLYEAIANRYSIMTLGQVLLLPQSNAEIIVCRRIRKNLIFVASTTLATKARSRYTELNRLVVKV